SAPKLRPLNFAPKHRRLSFAHQASEIAIPLECTFRGEALLMRFHGIVLILVEGAAVTHGTGLASLLAVEIFRRYEPGQPATVLVAPDRRLIDTRLGQRLAETLVESIHLLMPV